MLDTLTVEKGFEWGKDHLPPVCVIFITEHDVLGGGLPIYHSYRTIAELNHKRLGDNAEIIYVNASYQDEDTELGRLMHDMFCADPDEMYHKELAERSRYFKTNKHGVMKMCKLMEDLRAESFQSRAEGCLTNGGIRCYNDSRRGEVSERFKEPVLKTGDAAMHRGFESHPLRQL